METHSTDAKEYDNSKGTVFDDVFRTIAEKMPSLLIPLINEVFHTHYSKDETIIQLRNEHHEEFGNVTTDALVQIQKFLYHIECQSKRDGKMVIRMFEYDIAIAIENAEKQKDGTFRIYFPNSCVLYIRNHKGLPDHHKAIVIFPDGQTVEYRVPVVQARQYTVDQIFEKDLLMLLPYHILRYENFLKTNGTDKEKVEHLIQEYNHINQKLLNYCEEPEKSHLYTDIIGLITKIAEYIIPDSNPLKEEVNHIMRGQALQLMSEEFREEGYRTGDAAGFQRGTLNHAKETVVRVYTQAKSLDNAAYYAGVSEAQARTWLKEANLL